MVQQPNGSQLLTVFLSGSLLDLLHFVIVFLALVSPELGTVGRLDPTSAEHGEIVPSLDLLSMLLPTQFSI